MIAPSSGGITKKTVPIFGLLGGAVLDRCSVQQYPQTQLVATETAAPALEAKKQPKLPAIVHAEDVNVGSDPNYSSICVCHASEA
jgi:hypothetical protein